MTSPVRRQNTCIDVGGAVVLALVGIIFYVQCLRPWAQQDEARQAQRKQFLSLRQRAASAVSQERRSIQQLASLRNSMPASAAAREDVRQLNSRLSRITALASRQGLQLRNVEPGRASPDGDRVLLPIHLAGVADYRGCAQFLHAIRSEFADMSVNSLQMTARPAGAKTAVDFDMQLRWHAASAVVSVQN